MSSNLNASGFEGKEIQLETFFPNNDKDDLDFETTPQFNLTVTATDPEGLSDDAAITVNLTDVDDNPVENANTLKLIQPDGNIPATFRGHAGVSTDGLGTTSTGTIQAEIPEGSTVEFAFLHVATRTFDQPFRPASIGFEDFDVPVVFLDNVLDSTDENFEIGRADVTDLVREKVGNGGGIFDFTVDETVTGLPQNVEGTSLTVIYSNPSLPERTIFVLEGGLTGPTPQTNIVSLGTPLNTDDPEFIAELRLGIQFGSIFGRPRNGLQFSTVDVNGERLTSSAGDFDDGQGSNGQLITVGGVGDSVNNPQNPNSNTDSDDELYDLTPFVKTGDTEIKIETANPSDDDSIFLAVFTLPGTASLGNNNPPVITSSPTFSISENILEVGTITASDVNGDSLTFSISGGVDGELFTINETTGDLIFINAPDFETSTDTDTDNNYQVQVSVSDGTETVTQDLTVTVGDVNEAPTIDDAIFTVDENSDSGTEVGTVTASDPDAGDTLTYTITAGNIDPDGDGNQAFVIDSSTGTITVNDKDDLDFETTPQFNLTVTATDPESLSDDAAITVNLTDVVDGKISGIKWNDINGNGFRDSELIQGNNPDIIFTIDVSGSSDEDFKGTSIGDINQDGKGNTRLDAQLQGFIDLNNQLIAQGLGDTADVGIVVFSGRSNKADMNLVADGIQLTTNPNTDANNNGINDIEEILTSITSGAFGVGNNTGTNFKVALQEVDDTFEQLGTVAGDGNVVFLSDGKHNRGQFTDEVTQLNGKGVNLSAFGVGEDASLDDLKLIDPDATIFTTTDELLGVFGNISSSEGGNQNTAIEPGLPGVTIYLDQNNNGVLDADEPVTTTDESGKYEFTSLEPGTYIVREVIPQGFKQTFPFGSASAVGDGFADVVLDYFNSGTGTLDQPYGEDNEGKSPVPVSTDIILGSDKLGSLALPTGSFVTVGFNDETIVDRPGDDIFILENGAAGDQAEIFVSSDGENFVSLGIGNGGQTSSFDLGSINFTEPVVAVKIVGLDNKGSIPGFDVVNVQGLPDSIASPDFYTVDVAEGETVENINFGNTRGNITSGNDSDKITSSPDNKARSKGEPHLTTFDGIGYDFQGAGEFTLVKSNDGDLNIQIRYVQIDSRVTVATAVATEIEGQKVVIDSEGIEFDENGIPFVTRSTSGGTAKVTIDGVEVEIVSGGFIEVGNSRIYRSSGEKYTVVYAGEDGILGDGDDQLVVDYLRPGTINIVDVYLGDEQKGNITGLLGNLNDNPDDDIALPDSTVLPRPLEFDRLYGDYREAYRIKDISESLFTYAEGQNPDTFYNPNFPEALFTYANLDPEAKARGDAAALAAGYTPGTFDFESAAFDFAVTGDPGFLEGVESDPANIEPVPIIAPEPSNSETFISLIVTENGTIGAISSLGLFLPINLFAPNLQDIPFYEIAVSENKIYAVASPQELYQFDRNTQQFEAIATVDRQVNALGFDNNGILYGARDSNFFTIDPLTGQTNVIADLGSDFRSSGDISFDVEESVFYATSSLGDNGNDLYKITLDGEATKIGSIGYERVWGLSFEDDNLIGFTDNNRIIIDQNSGQGVLETTIPGINSIFGAAST